MAAWHACTAETYLPYSVVLCCAHVVMHPSIPSRVISSSSAWSAVVCHVPRLFHVVSCFIRHGWKGDAVLAVTLLNNEHGFKYDEYGASITVKRTIKQPSGGGYELLDHDGKVNVKVGQRSCFGTTRYPCYCWLGWWAVVT